MASYKAIDGANKHIKDVMRGASERLREIQSEPIGTEKRSKSEFDKMIQDIQNTPHEDRQDKLMQLAMIAGHKGNKPDGCAMCNMMKNMSEK